ncbi:MAG: MBL fold metallo-hydrolase [Thermomicrobiales bacterium]
MPLELEVLGSGGAYPTPMPGTNRPVSVEALAHGSPDARTGPSLFLHGPDILFDTPEESRIQLARAGIGRVNACFYSHWHPDHTMGRRVFEMLGSPDLRDRAHRHITEVYLPQQVAADARTRLALWDHLAFMESQGFVRVHVVDDGERVRIGEGLDAVAVTPFRVAEDYVYAFLVEGREHRVLIAMDELVGWTPPALGPLDLAWLPIGIFEFHPRTGERRIPADHPLLREEATYADTIAIARQLDARRIVLGHIEAPDGFTHDELLGFAADLRAEGLPVTIAHDGLLFPLGES